MLRTPFRRCFVCRCPVLLLVNVVRGCLRYSSSDLTVARLVALVSIVFNGQKMAAGCRW